MHLQNGNDIVYIPRDRDREIEREREREMIEIEIDRARDRDRKGLFCFYRTKGSLKLKSWP